MKLAAVRQQLTQAGFKRVQGALEMAALDKAPGLLPAHYVIPMTEDAVPNRSVGVHDQAESDTFGVVTMVQGGISNDRTSDELEELTEKLKLTLAGWTPPGASRACDFVSGRIVSVSGNTVSWLSTFRTGRHIRKAQA